MQMHWTGLKRTVLAAFFSQSFLFTVPLIRETGKQKSNIRAVLPDKTGLNENSI